MSLLLRHPRLLYGTCLLVLAATANGADNSDASRFRVMPYLWGAQFDGTLGAANSGTGDPIDVDLGFGELTLSGVMLFGEWRKGPWSVIGDWSYARVSSDTDLGPGLLYSGATATVRGHILEAALGYAIYQHNDAIVDLFGGLRYINLDVRLDLNAGLLLPAAQIDADDDWVDGIVGVRGTLPLSGQWRLGWYADAGAGGSDLTWQLSASLGYQFGWGSVVGGWRYLNDDYQKSGLRLDAALTGPFIGADFSF
jgi:hypothetical protein